MARLLDTLNMGSTPSPSTGTRLLDGYTIKEPEKNSKSERVAVNGTQIRLDTMIKIPSVQKEDGAKNQEIQEVRISLRDALRAVQRLDADFPDDLQLCTEEIATFSDEFIKHLRRGFYSNDALTRSVNAAYPYIAAIHDQISPITR